MSSRIILPRPGSRERLELGRQVVKLHDAGFSYPMVAHRLGFSTVSAQKLGAEFRQHVREMLK